jgi:hypothetical protein
MVLESLYRFLIRVMAAGINAIISNRETIKISLILPSRLLIQPPNRAPIKIPISQFDKDSPKMISFPRATTRNSLNNIVWVVTAMKPVKKNVTGIKNGDNFSEGNGWMFETILVNQLLLW